eukprot:gene16002-5774_t
MAAVAVAGAAIGGLMGGEGSSMIRKQLNAAKCKTACGCCVYSPCYCDFPDCIGCSQTRAFLFCRQSYKCTKICCGVSECKQQLCTSPHDEACCGKDFLTVWTESYQYMNFVGALQFPCGSEVPFSVGLLGVFCIGGEHWN